jgi:hypothetical protein
VVDAGHGHAKLTVKAERKPDSDEKRACEARAVGYRDGFHIGTADIAFGENRPGKNVNLAQVSARCELRHYAAIRGMDGMGIDLAGKNISLGKYCSRGFIARSLNAEGYHEIGLRSSSAGKSRAFANGMVCFPDLIFSSISTSP